MDETQRRDSPRVTIAGAPDVRLTCIGGPATGQAFVLVGEAEMVIGRADENAICIRDSSVSRRHAVLRRRGTEWTISDLGSGHGTLVNGKRVEGAVLLVSGDIVTIGGSALRFTDAETTQEISGVHDPTDVDRTNSIIARARLGGATTDPTELHDPGSEPMLLDARSNPGAPDPSEPEVATTPASRYVATGEPAPRIPAPPAPRTGGAPRASSSGPRAKSTATIAAPGGTQGSGPQRRLGDLPLRTRAARDAERRRKRRDLLMWGALIASLCLIPILARATFNVMAERRAFRERAAKRRLEEAFQKGKELLRARKWAEAREQLLKVQEQEPAYPVQDFIDRAEKEEINQSLLEAAASAVEKGQLARAAEALAKVAPDTGMRVELDDVKDQLSRKVASRLREARSALVAGKLDEVTDITADVLKAVPGEPDALSLRDQATRLGAGGGTPKKR